MKILLALSLSLSLAACVDDDAPFLDDTTAALGLSDSVRSGFYQPVVPAVFRGADHRVQIAGVNAYGMVAWDIQREAGVWGAPNPTVVAFALRASHVAAAQDAAGRTVIVAVAGTSLRLAQQLAPGSRSFANWVYVDTAVANRKPSLAANRDGRLELAYLSSTGTVKLARQTGTGAWTTPAATLLRSDAAPELVRDRQDRLELFAAGRAPSCGVTAMRQVAPDSATWTASASIATPCLASLTVGYADDATEVLGQEPTGALRHYRRAGSTQPFSEGPLGLYVARPLSRPTFVAKDDGRLFAFASYTPCAPGVPPGTGPCNRYLASQREGGAWWAWQPFAGWSGAPGVAGADSLINNTYVLVATDAQYDRALFRY